MALPRHGRIIRILGLLLGCSIFRVPGTLAELYNVETFPVDTSEGNFRNARGGASVVYACNAGEEYGPCVDTPSLCSSQGGKIVGYCFFDGRYEGICCSGLDPANATLTTKPPQAHEDTTTAGPFPTMQSSTLPPAPTPPTTQTMPPPPPSSTIPPPPPSSSLPPNPTMTTDTMPPNPTMTTNTMPPAPPSSSLPPNPTMTTNTMPPNPTMTTNTMPPAPPSSTLPPNPTMTTNTMPPNPTMTTNTMPPAPPSSSLPPNPTMTTNTMPPNPTMTTETMPPSPTTQTPPSMPTMTPPPSSSIGGVFEDTTTAGPFPTMQSTLPPAPTPPTTQTMPPPPPSSTMPPPPPSSSLPPNPTMTKNTMPPNPTMTTNTMPPAPPSSSLPPNPTMTTDTMPPNPTMTTNTMPPAPPSSTLPPNPTMTTDTMPPNPTMTTNTMPPAPPSSSLPPNPTMTTNTMPPNPTMTTETMPPSPTTQTPPSMPTMTPPPSSSIGGVFEDTTTTATTTTTRRPFPTFGTMPPMNMSTPHQPNNTMTTQQWNYTTSHWNFTTQQHPNFTMSTMPMPTFPNGTTTTEMTTTGVTEVPSEETTTAAPPSGDVPGGGGCGETITTEIQSLFQNPSYPSLDTEATVYQYVVMPQDGFCALRVEFLEALLAGEGMQGCSSDSVLIINSEDSPTTPVCGLLQGYEWTVRQVRDQPVRIVVTTQSSAYLWSINVTQIQCSSIKPYQEFESPNCGIKNPKPPPAGIEIPPEPEQPKVISPTKLLKSKRKTLREIMSAPLAPAKLLQNAVLNRESSIKIVRGNETGVNEWPWQALLMVNGRPLCGASIINEEWIVTAGHCVHLNLRYPLVSVMTVDLGDHDLRTVKETKNVVARISKIVPNVQNEGVRNDIALIKLATKIPFSKTIRPVCLPQPGSPANTYAGETGITTGWGRTEDSVISPVLREAALPIISNERCRQQWSSVGEGAGSIIESGMICVGGGDVGPCNGDSGGPLVVQDNDKYRLVGLTSFGLLKGCAVPGVPSVYARVTSYADWIALNLAAS